MSHLSELGADLGIDLGIDLGFVLDCGGHIASRMAEPAGGWRPGETGLPVHIGRDFRPCPPCPGGTLPTWTVYWR